MKNPKNDSDEKHPYARAEKAIPSTDPRLARVLDLTRELEERKKLYAELDLLILELASEGFNSAQLDGLVLTLKDNFATGNVGWATAAVKRFEIEIITKELAEKREKRKLK